MLRDGLSVSCFLCAAADVRKGALYYRYVAYLIPLISTYKSCSIIFAPQFVYVVLAAVFILI